MENGEISDAQIDASSKRSANHAAQQGRLQFQATGIKAGAWSAATNDANQWLQVDLTDRYTRVTGVATQGRNAFYFSEWVTEYRLRYSNDGVNFRYYKQQGQTQTTDKVKLAQIPAHRKKGQLSILLWQKTTYLEVVIRFKTAL